MAIEGNIYMGLRYCFKIQTVSNLGVVPNPAGERHSSSNREEQGCYISTASGTLLYLRPTSTRTDVIINEKGAEIPLRFSSLEPTTTLTSGG